MSGIDAGIRIGKYEVGRKLGQGGFGILHVAHDQELGRDVAIKFLRPEHVFKPTVVQRFLQEARAAARINHPGIVTVFESGIVGGTNTLADGTVYISMELLAGDTLAQKIRSLGRLPLHLAINYTRQLASALGAAHEAGIVHRDLKPANVFIVQDAAVTGGERLKVLDFGIAKLADDFGSGMQTHSMLMLGTPMYMSPEQCKSSAKVDARSDVYSLGCILFEMLCGKPPFDGDSGELIAKHQLVAPPTARSLVGEVSEPLDRLVASMLAKSPSDRPQTMALVEDALSELDSRALETPSIVGGMLPDLSGDTPTTVEPSPMRKRVPILAASTSAAVFAIIAYLTMCGDKKPSAEANVAEDAAAVATQPPLATADASVIDAVVATAPPVDVGELRVECQEYLANQHWPELSECADRLAKFDQKTGKTYKATAQLETLAAKEMGAIEDAIEKKDNERAKKLLAAVSPASVYRKQAEKVVTTGKPASKKPGCDGEELKDKGLDLVNEGQHAAALAAFEGAYRCKADSYYAQMAFMAACNAQNKAKAQQYYDTLTPTQRKKYEQMCIRNKIKLENPATAVAPPENCDADTLKDKGMENVNMGQHAAALAQFEASMRCKPDSYVLSLAFMAACNAQNAPKAKLYWPKMSAAQQTKYKVMCVRNHIAVP